METKYQEAFLSKYKIEPSTLIEKIATKYFGKIKSIGLTTLISEEVEKEGIEANEEFYKMLIEALAEGGIKLPENQKLQEVNVAFEIPNQQVSIPKSKGDLQDFKDIVSTDDLRPVMMGVYVSKDGYLVGTDAHKLVKFKSNLFYGEEVDKIIDLKKYIGTNGKSIDFIDGKYPNYDAIIPRDNEYKRTSLNTYAFYNFCKSTIYLKKYQTSDIFHLTLLIEGKEYTFNPILFAELLEFALRKGFENFDIEVSESQTRAMLLKFAGGSEGLIMPIYSDSNVPRTIPYEIDEIQRLFRSGKTAKKSASPSPKKPKAIETPKTDAFKKFEGDIEDTIYVSRREIRSIELESGEMLSKNDVIDGFYRLKKKYEVGGVVERYDNPLFNQGMQGELSGFGTSSPMSVFANGGTTDPQKFNQDNLMAEGGKMSIIEQILKKYNVQEDKTDETRDWLKKEWEGKNIDDYVMYSDKYTRGGKLSPAQERAFFDKTKTKFTQSDAERLVGKFIEIYGQGQDEPIAFSKIAKATIDPNYSQKTLVIYTEVGTQERIPEDKIDAFFNGFTIVLSIPSKGSYYGLKLIKEPNKYAKGGEVAKIVVTEGKSANKKTWVISHPNIEEKGIYFQDEYSKEQAKQQYYENVLKLYGYAEGGEVGKDYVFVGNTMINGEYKPVYKKDNKYYLKYYNPTKYNFLADEKDIKNYRIGRATDTFSKGGEVESLKVGSKIGFLRPQTGRYEYAEVVSIDENNVNLVVRHPKRSQWDNYFTETKERISKFLNTPSEDWKDGRPIVKIKYAKGGEVEITNSTIDRGGLGNVQDSILAKGGLLKKVESFGKKAMKKAKPVAKKIVRKTKKYGAVALKKAKIGFDALAEKVAKSYEGKKVKPKYQGEYGKTYSKAEAKEVGEKVSAKVYRQQLGKRKITRKLRNKTK